MASRLYEIAFRIGGKIAPSFPQSLTGAAGKLDQVNKKISQLEQAQGQVTRFRALHNEIDATKLKLRQAEAEVRNLGSVMGPMTADMAKKFEAARGKAEKLRLEYRAQGAELKNVRAAMEGAGIAQRTLAADSSRLNANLAKARASQKSMRELQGSLQANQKAREAAKTRFGESKGKLLGAAGGVAAVALPAVVAAKFEDSMVRAGALAHATDEQMAAMTAQARKLGRDTRFSASQAAEGMQYLAMSGFKTNEIMSAMPGMLDIAAAGMVDVGMASNITSNILRGFGMDASKATRLGDVMTNTFTNSNTTLELLGETMKYVAPNAKASGLSLEKTAAAAGILANAGIKGEQAGTGLRAMLLRMAAPPKKARDALASLGVKTKDAAGNMVPLDEILGKINKKTEKMGSGKKLGLVAEIFGQEAASAAIQLLAGQASGALDEMTAKVAKSGTAAEIAAKQNATMAGQWDNFKGSVEEVGITLGYQLIPTLKTLVDRVVPIINKVTEWANAHPKLTQALILGAAGLASLNFAMVSGGLALNGMRLGILSVQGGLLKLNSAALSAAASNALIIAGVAGLAAIGIQLQQNWGPIMQWWDDQWDDMFDSVADMVNQVTPLLRGLGFDVGDMQKGVLRKFGRGEKWGVMAEKLGKFQKYGAPEDPNAEPDWLKKNPTNRRFPSFPVASSAAVEGRMAASKRLAPTQAGAGRMASAGLLGAAEKLGKASGGSGGGKGGDSFVFSPQISVHPGAPMGTKEAVGASVDEMRKMFEDFSKKQMDRTKRTGFGQ